MFAWTLRPEMGCIDNRTTTDSPGETRPAPWIEVITPERATGKLADVYREMQNPGGSVANIQAIHSLFPEALDAQMQLAHALFDGCRELTRTNIELIATVISMENCCDYCAHHHRSAYNDHLKREGKPVPEDLDHVEWNLDTRQMAMLHLATKLAHTPHAISEDDIEQTKVQGFTDRAILEIVLLAAHVCAINRIALGLGVAMEGK